jgi:hypothetical protein
MKCPLILKCRDASPACEDVGDFNFWEDPEKEAESQARDSCFVEKRVLEHKGPISVHRTE